MSLFGIPRQKQLHHVQQQIVVNFYIYLSTIYTEFPFYWNYNTLWDVVDFVRFSFLFVCFFPEINAETAKKIIIPESIAIKLANSSEVSAEYFFRDIYRRYQQLQKDERRRERQRSSKKNRFHQLPSSLANRERKTVDSVVPQSTISSTIETSSMIRSTFVPIQSTTAVNTFIMKTKDQVAYVDDEDLTTDLEASGSNRIRNDTLITYQLDDSSSENEN